jgi:hypothetical protein
MDEKTFWRGIVEQFSDAAALEIAIGGITRLRWAR